MENNKREKVEKKNYSFYMVSDFEDKLDKLQASDDELKALSKSQALYLIISKLAAKIQ